MKGGGWTNHKTLHSIFKNINVFEATISCYESYRKVVVSTEAQTTRIRSADWWTVLSPPIDGRLLSGEEIGLLAVVVVVVGIA